MELHIVVNNAPMLMGIMLLAVLVHSEWLRCSILPPTIVVDAYLEYRIGPCWSSCFHGRRKTQITINTVEEDVYS